MHLDEMLELTADDVFFAILSGTMTLTTFKEWYQLQRTVVYEEGYDSAVDTTEINLA